jgi:hypothetical protein
MYKLVASANHLHITQLPYTAEIICLVERPTKLGSSGTLAASYGAHMYYMKQ